MDWTPIDASVQSWIRLGALWEIATDDLNDHAPLYYALKVWNAYVSDL